MKSIFDTHILSGTQNGEAYNGILFDKEGNVVGVDYDRVDQNSLKLKE